MYGQNIADKPMQSMGHAFSVIELIFVILVIGILTAVAIPRLTQSANNAKLTMAVSNMYACIREAGAHYALYRTHLPLGDGLSCNNIKCYTLSISDANFTVTTNNTDEIYCSDIENIGGHLAKSYQF